MDEVLRRFTWVDWVVVLVVLGCTVQGIRRGFGPAALELVGTLLAVGLALAALQPARQQVLRYLPLSRTQAELVALFGLIVVGRLLVGLVLGLGYGARVRRPGSAIGALGGAAPGLVEGLVIAALALMPFASYPLLPEVSIALQDSVIAGPLAAVSSPLAEPGGVSALRR
jgi:uncharacterized membrane protein required for colicin V production